MPFLHPGGLGQWEESGRDQGHTIMGIGLMSAFCETAWSQGVDLYGYDDNRVLKGAEYVAKYNLGCDVPFTEYTWGTGTNCAHREQTVSPAAGGVRHGRSGPWSPTTTRDGGGFRRRIWA